MASKYCKNCGYNFDEFVNSGHLQCSECYKYFDLNEYIFSRQKSLSHIGTIPKKNINANNKIDVSKKIDEYDKSKIVSGKDIKFEIVDSDFDEIIVSSRIRLARNIKDINFPNSIYDYEQAKAILNSLSYVFENDECLNFRALKNLSNSQIELLLESHLISPALIDNKDIAGVGFEDENIVSIMINEEDHIREQCIIHGMELDLCYDILKDIDEKIFSHLDIAFDNDLGYLTSHISNLGTGMRASVMMFLPILTMTGQIEKLIDIYKTKNITFRGFYGEGTSSQGYFYQVSNSKTLGVTENEIIKSVNDAVLEIKNLEMLARKTIMETKKVEIEDIVHRAYAVLRNCDIMSNEEFLELTSKVKLGMYLGILNIDLEDLSEICTFCSNEAIISEYGDKLTERERNIIRAKLVKEIGIEELWR